MRGALVRTLVLIACLVATTSGARAAVEPVEGFDCECTKTGDYVLPSAPVDISPASATTGLSPDGKYSVSATTGGGNNPWAITVTKVSGSEVLLSSLPAKAWGFSPDGDRFVRYVDEAGPIVAYVHNLTSSSPGTNLLPGWDVTRSGVVAFSPDGRWAVGLKISSASLQPELLDLTVIDAETGSVMHSAELHLNLADLLPDELPDGTTELGVMRLGFSPDVLPTEVYGPDARSYRSLAYAWIDGSLKNAHATLVNLETKAAKVTSNSTHGFDWGFSPCGDVFGIVVANTDTPQNLPYLFSTITHDQLGDVVAFSIADDHFLRVEAGNVSGTMAHVLHHGLSGKEQLALNTAAGSCGGDPDPPVKPLAVFKVSAPPYSTGIGLEFTNESTTLAGTLTSYVWSFGEGGWTATTKDASFTYATAGAHEVSLTVYNSFGLSDTVMKTINVTANEPPAVSFSTSVDGYSPHANATLTDTSTDDDGIVTSDWFVYYLDPTWPVTSASGDDIQVTLCPGYFVTHTVSDHANHHVSVTEPIGSGTVLDLPVAPGESLRDAAASACPGDTLVLDEGHYAGGIELSGVSVQGAGRGKTFIDADGDDVIGLLLTPAPVNFLTSTWVEARIAALTLVGSNGGGGLEVQGPTLAEASSLEVTGFRWGVGVGDRARLTVKDSHIHHNGDGGSHDPEFSALSVLDSEIAHNGGIFLLSGAFTGNYVHDNDGYGLTARGYGSAGPILDNRFVANRVDDDYPLIDIEDPTLFAGNLVAANEAAGVGYFEQNPPVAGDLVIRNSTIAHNCGPAVTLMAPAFDNSIVTGNEVDPVGATWVNASIIGRDPGFTTRGDYHLAADSPALDAGDDALVPTELLTDGDGDDRIGAAHVDIGWDEWKSEQPSWLVALPSCAPTGYGGEGDTGGNGGSGGKIPGGSDGGTSAKAGEAGQSGEAGHPVQTSGAPGAGGSGGSDGRGGTSAGGRAGPETGGKAGEDSVGAGGTRTGAAGSSGGRRTIRPKPSDGGSCGCRVPSRRAPDATLASVVAILFAALKRRTSRRRTPSRSTDVAHP